jgi:hypothetical protein
MIENYTRPISMFIEDVEKRWATLNNWEKGQRSRRSFKNISLNLILNSKVNDFLQILFALVLSI